MKRVYLECHIAMPFQWCYYAFIVFTLRCRAIWFIWMMGSLVYCLALNILRSRPTEPPNPFNEVHKESLGLWLYLEMEWRPMWHPPVLFYIFEAYSIDSSKISVILLKSRTSTGYSSNSIGSSITNRGHSIIQIHNNVIWD